jgi:hypothetical protein
MTLGPPSLSQCPVPVEGIDCSGFIVYCAQSTGIGLNQDTTGSDQLANPDTWNAPGVMPSGWGLEMTVVTDGSYQLGDIVAWPGEHVGIVGTNGPTYIVSQSNGYVGSAGCNAQNPGAHGNNLDAKHGPRAVLLQDIITKWGLGEPTTLRLVASPDDGGLDGGDDARSSDATVNEGGIHAGEGGSDASSGDAAGADATCENDIGTATSGNCADLAGTPCTSFYGTRLGISTATEPTEFYAPQSSWYLADPRDATVRLAPDEPWAQRVWLERGNHKVFVSRANTRLIWQPRDGDPWLP